MISGYKILWLLVLFDLPVTTKKNRKAATKFRKNLLDFGFEMTQFSVYLKWCYGYEAARTWANRVEKLIPKEGQVKIIVFTDKQYEKMVTIDGPKRSKNKKVPEQFELF